MSKRITPQSFRISLATNLHINGCDIISIQQLLGHTDVRTTLGYVQTSPELHRHKYSQFVPLYHDSQRTDRALLIRRLQHDPLNTVASHCLPSAYPRKNEPTVIDAEIIKIEPNEPSKNLRELSDRRDSEAKNLDPKKSKSEKITGTKKSKSPKFASITEKVASSSESAASSINKSWRILRVSRRQRKALMRMMETCDPMTKKLYCAITDAGRQIATKDLLELCEKGLIAREGKGRGVRYWIAEGP